MRYHLCPGHTDMRKSFNTLSGVIINKMGQDVRSGDVYIFINRNKNLMKILHAEEGGLVLYSKRLEEGTFRVPDFDEETQSYPMTWSDLVQDSSSQQILDFLMQDKVEMQAQMKVLQDRNEQLQNRLDELLSQLSYLQRKLFGKSK